MPTYRFENTKTNEITEELMSISEMEKHIKKRHINLLPPTQMNIVSGVGSMDSKTDGGWKEMLSRVAEAHPQSNLADRYGKKSNNEIKTKQLLNKYRKKKK
jgi:hypothetical protein